MLFVPLSMILVTPSLLCGAADDSGAGLQATGPHKAQQKARAEIRPVPQGGKAESKSTLRGAPPGRSSPGARAESAPHTRARARSGQEAPDDATEAQPAQRAKVMQLHRLVSAARMAHSFAAVSAAHHSF